MQNKKLIILVVLGIAAVLSLLYGIFTSSKTKYKFISGQEGAGGRGTTLAIKTIRDKRRTNYASWGRDPFSTSGALIKTSTGLILNGILWDEKIPLAIINDDIVKIGDKVSGNIVIDIKKDSVILNDGAKDFELRLGQ